MTTQLCVPVQFILHRRAAQFPAQSSYTFSIDCKCVGVLKFLVKFRPILYLFIAHPLANNSIHYNGNMDIIYMSPRASTRPICQFATMPDYKIKVNQINHTHWWRVLHFLSFIPLRRAPEIGIIAHFVPNKTIRREEESLLKGDTIVKNSFEYIHNQFPN